MVYRRFASCAFFARVSLLSLLASAFLLLSLTAQSSPGAHGPNGEHLDMEQSNQATQRPKFESFTESFELLGEVFRNELLIYLHDFESNTPIESASIDLEVGSFAASATYDEDHNRYVVVDNGIVNALNNSGEHDVIMTIMTDDNADLLVANFVMPEMNAHTSDAEHSHDEEHHHFPWWALGLSVVVFALGFFFGRKNKGVKS